MIKWKNIACAWGGIESGTHLFFKSKKRRFHFLKSNPRVKTSNRNDKKGSFPDEAKRAIIHFGLHYTRLSRSLGFNNEILTIFQFYSIIIFFLLNRKISIIWITRASRNALRPGAMVLVSVLVLVLVKKAIFFFFFLIIFSVYLFLFNYFNRNDVFTHLHY